MTWEIARHNLRGQTPFRIYLQIVDMTAEQRGLGFQGSITNLHIDNGIATNGPQLLGRQIDHYHALRHVRMGYAPATAFHIDGYAMTFFGGGGSLECSAQSLKGLGIGREGSLEMSYALAGGELGE